MCLAIKNVLRMQGGHKPFSYVTISFSPLHYLIYSQFCLIWTLLLYIWKTDKFAWLFVYVSLNLVTFVFDLSGNIGADGALLQKSCKRVVVCDYESVRVKG